MSIRPLFDEIRLVQKNHPSPRLGLYLGLSNQDSEFIKRDSLANAAYLLGSGLLLLVVILTVTVSISLAFGATITGYHFPVSVAGAVLGIIAFGRRLRLNTPKINGCAVAFVVLVAAAIGVSLYFFDISFDGQNYHQEGILRLTSGWNPYYQSLVGEYPGYASGDGVLEKRGLFKGHLLTHYAKGPWLQGSAIVSATRRIETAKTTNLLLLSASWLLALSLLLRVAKLPRYLTFSFATLAAFNPVSTCQALSHYVDGQLSSLMLILLVAMLMSALHLGLFATGVAALSILLLVNVKFTGVVYAAVLIAAFGVTVFLLSGPRAAMTRSGGLLLGYLFGVLLIGFNPYLTNTLNHGNPFYPLAGDRKVDILTVINRPRAFENMNRLQALGHSVFSASGYGELRPKLPFSVTSQRELWTFTGGDTRLGGWGPLFSGLTVLGALGLIAVLLSSDNRALKYGTVACVISLLATVLVNPEPWWARFTPQLWLVPLAIFLACYLSGISHLRKLAMISLLVTFVNIVLVAVPYVKGNISKTSKVRHELHTLQSAQNHHLYVYFDSFVASRARLSEAGLEYTRVHSLGNLPCSSPLVLAGSYNNVKYCMHAN